jgi:hypothetical protein
VLAAGLVGRDDKLGAIVPLHLVQPANAAAVLAIVAGYFLAAW